VDYDKVDYDLQLLTLYIHSLNGSTFNELALSRYTFTKCHIGHERVHSCCV